MIAIRFTRKVNPRTNLLYLLNRRAYIRIDMESKKMYTKFLTKQKKKTFLLRFTLQIYNDHPLFVHPAPHSIQILVKIPWCVASWYCFCILLLGASKYICSFSSIFLLSLLLFFNFFFFSFVLFTGICGVIFVKRIFSYLIMYGF